MYIPWDRTSLQKKNNIKLYIIVKNWKQTSRWLLYCESSGKCDGEIKILSCRNKRFKIKFIFMEIESTLRLRHWN